jgi:hypothetical protein
MAHRRTLRRTEYDHHRSEESRLLLGNGGARVNRDFLRLARSVFALAFVPLAAIAAAEGPSPPKPPAPPPPARARESTEEPEYTGTIRGRVLDADGRPVGAGVEVGADRPGQHCTPPRNGESASALTADDGTFVLEKLTSMEFTVHARRTIGEEIEAALAFRIPEGSTEVVLRLAPVDRSAPRPALAREPSPHEPAATAITGRLVLAPGPDRAHHLAIKGTPESGGVERQFPPSWKGVFDTGTLPAGRWNLRVLAPSGLVVGEAHGIATGSRGIEIPISPHGEIRGRVLLPGGESAGPGVTVWAANQGEGGRSCPGGTARTETDEHGAFLLEYLGDFRFGLMAQGPRKSDRFPFDLVPGPAALDVAPGARDIFLTLAPRAPLKGTLLTADGIPAVPHRLVGSRKDNLHLWESVSGKDGTFEFPELPPGRVRIFYRWGDKEIDLGEPEAPATDVVLRLPAK